MSPQWLKALRGVASSRLPDRVLGLLLLSALIVCESNAASVMGAGRPRVVLILVDGVRWDYLSEADLPGFGELAKTGVKAEYVVPIMPANSYPNWYSIVTGLYGERHGFVQNYMYDEKHDDFFTMAPNPNASNPHWWNHAEPVWVTAEKNGLRTAMYWWDGCQVEIRGVKPTKCIQYRDYWQWPTVENDTKAALSEIVDNFKQNKLDFALVYYEAVDAEGHGSGPDSMERRRALKSADNVIKHLLDEAKRQNIRDQLSLIVVSDHGMTDTTEGKFELIDIEPHIDANDIHSMLDGGSFAMLRPHPDKIEKIYAKLKSLNIKGLNVFKREELPELYHLKETYLTQPIVLTADPGYQIKKLQGTDKQVPQSSRIYKGNHGYDPMKLEDMRAIFLATGPGLKQGFQGGPVRMVDHYNVICRQLGIQPLENSGSQDSVRDMFTGGASGSAAASLSLLLVPNILLAARGYLYH
ncbi:glycerophosphocholine cholinephosphodiesterase ENPP6-like isoform X2 [Dermacentor albipictus]|uniref:glycerophosphocholine cholinephosphodiesterase ENPP6-like isoform X2 n=1 Tax=Dermacentor albipictus TaxID=60249 RepID=UPI0031FC57E6